METNPTEAEDDSKDEFEDNSEDDSEEEAYKEVNLHQFLILIKKILLWKYAVLIVTCQNSS